MAISTSHGCICSNRPPRWLSLMLNWLYELVEHASGWGNTRAVTSVFLRDGMDLTGEMIPVIVLHIGELTCPRAGDSGCIDISQLTCCSLVYLELPKLSLGWEDGSLLDGRFLVGSLSNLIWGIASSLLDNWAASSLCCDLVKQSMLLELLLLNNICPELLIFSRRESFFYGSWDKGWCVVNTFSLVRGWVQELLLEYKGAVALISCLLRSCPSLTIAWDHHVILEVFILLLGMSPFDFLLILANSLDLYILLRLREVTSLRTSLWWI